MYFIFGSSNVYLSRHRSSHYSDANYGQKMERQAPRGCLSGTTDYIAGKSSDNPGNPTCQGRLIKKLDSTIIFAKQVSSLSSSLSNFVSLRPFFSPLFVAEQREGPLLHIHIQTLGPLHYHPTETIRAVLPRRAATRLTPPHGSS